MIYTILVKVRLKHQIKFLILTPFRVLKKNYQFRKERKITNVHKDFMAQVLLNASHVIFPVLNVMAQKLISVILVKQIFRNLILKYIIRIKDFAYAHS